MGDTEFFQQLGNTFQTCAVQRGVDELERINARAVAHAQVVDRLHKIIQTGIVNANDFPRCGGSVKICQPDIVKAINFFDSCQNFLGSLQGNLAAVCAVDLVAVVLGRVVAGGHTNASAAAEIPHRPRKRRGGFQPGVHIGRDAVGCQYTGSLAGEQLPIMAAVVGDGDLFGQVACVQVVRQPLCCLAHGVKVHTVSACTDDPAQTAGTEF